MKPDDIQAFDTNTEYENRVLAILDRLPEWVGRNVIRPAGWAHALGPISGCRPEVLQALTSVQVENWIQLGDVKAAEILRLGVLSNDDWRWLHSEMASRSLHFRVAWEPIYGRRAGTRDVPRRPSICGVYFIKAAERVKIGVAVCIQRRLTMLQIGSADKLECIGYIPAKPGHEAISIERELHGRMEAHRIHGEWFNLNDDLRCLVAERGRPWPYVEATA